jgi:uncharacterized protein (TIGR02271 family)
MSNRQGKDGIRPGMTVYAADGQPLGTIERLQGTALVVHGRAIARALVARVTPDGVYLDGRHATDADATGAIRVPVAEERLTVATREAELGAVQIRKTVTEERQSVPVTLRREEAHVEAVDFADRPLRPEEDVFTPGVITVNLRGEEAVVAKETVVTGEVVIDKTAVVEEHRITDTVRKEHVAVEQTAARATTTRKKGRKSRKG